MWNENPFNLQDEALSKFKFVSGADTRNTISVAADDNCTRALLSKCIWCNIYRDHLAFLKKKAEQLSETHNEPSLCNSMMTC